MRARTLTLALLGAALSLWSVPPACAAGAVDLAKYLFQSPGYWTILEESDSGGTGYTGSMVESAGAMLVQSQYGSHDGVTWRLEELTAFRVDDQKITIVGHLDPATDIVWIMKPAAAIPRYVDVGQPIFFPMHEYRKDTGEKASVEGWVVMVTRAGLTVDAAGSTLADCVEWGNGNVYFGLSQDAASATESGLQVACPGYGEVEGRGAEVSPLTGGGYGVESAARRVVGLGTSAPPFPAALRGGLLQALQRQLSNEEQ